MRKAISYFIILCLLLSVTFTLSPLPVVYAEGEEQEEVFQTTSVTKVIVVTDALNVRSGPGKAYNVAAIVYRGNVLRVIGEAWGWYVVYLPNHVIGYVSSVYAKPYTGTQQPITRIPTPAPTPTPTPAPTPTPTPAPGITTDMQKMLNLINAERAKVGAAALKFDSQVNNTALAKAKDMVSKNYFSHTSPTYGSPFDMLRQFGVTFRTAGENLAGNQTVEAAHTALMNSAGHRANILNANFNYIGLGIQPSPNYGKIFVQMFIGR